MTTFTLDTNCFIAVDEGRLEAEHVKALVDAASSQEHSVALLASSASERQLGGGHLSNINEFRERMNELGLGHLELLRPIGKYGLSFWGFGIYPSSEQKAREKLIFQTLFPNFPTSWADYAREENIEVENLSSAKAWKWRNRLCDVQAYWSHENAGREVFVTSDPNFGKKLIGHDAFPNAAVMTPQDAAKLL